MKIGVLGTGDVGRTLGRKFIELGHEVMLGSRSADNAKATEWAQAAGVRASHGTFTDAAGHGEEVVFNCTNGSVSLQALEGAGAETLKDKILVDVANPLDFSRGFPPSLTVCNTDSLAEQIQRAYPDTRVVKALNTVNCQVMVEPSRAGKSHDLFVCGNDATAKQRVTAFLQDELGWQTVHDLGGIDAARGMEAYLLLWVRLYGVFNNPNYNIHVSRPEG